MRLTQIEDEFKEIRDAIESYNEDVSIEDMIGHYNKLRSLRRKVKKNNSKVDLKTDINNLIEDIRSKLREREEMSSDRFALLQDIDDREQKTEKTSDAMLLPPETERERKILHELR